MIGAFAYFGAMCIHDSTNVFDNLIFSPGTSMILLIASFAYAVIVVLPVVVRSSLMAKYFVYIGGMCDVPCNYFSGIIFPWIAAILLSHI